MRGSDEVQLTQVEDSVVGAERSEVNALLSLRIYCKETHLSIVGNLSRGADEVTVSTDLTVDSEPPLDGVPVIVATGSLIESASAASSIVARKGSRGRVGIAVVSRVSEDLEPLNVAAAGLAADEIASRGGIPVVWVRPQSESSIEPDAAGILWLLGNALPHEDLPEATESEWRAKDATEPFGEETPELIAATTAESSTPGQLGRFRKVIRSKRRVGVLVLLALMVVFVCVWVWVVTHNVASVVIALGACVVVLYLVRAARRNVAATRSVNRNVAAVAARVNDVYAESVLAARNIQDLTGRVSGLTGQVMTNARDLSRVARIVGIAGVQLTELIAREDPAGEDLSRV
jgi:hypothetical protein